MIALDQITKLYIGQTLALGESLEVLPGIFYIRYVENTGAAFSLFSGHTKALGIVTLVVILGIFIYMARLPRDESRLYKLSLVIIVAGGMGNAIDRFLRGYVVDFFDFVVWPVFNVADIFVCLGCGLLIFCVFIWLPLREKRKGRVK